MERETGIEPATSSLGSLRSTTELLPRRDIEILSVQNIVFIPEYVKKHIKKAGI